MDSPPSQPADAPGAEPSAAPGAEPSAAPGDEPIVDTAVAPTDPSSPAVTAGADDTSQPIDTATVDTVDLDAIAGDLADVERAMERLEAATYWTDEVTGAPLDDAYLAEHPTARRAADDPAPPSAP